MDVWEEVVTPERAKELVFAAQDGDDWRNRRVSENCVRAYASDMAEGRWKESANIPIYIDQSGRVIDGQHRLFAVIRAKKPIRFVFMRTERTCFDAFDKGKKRTLSDSLSCNSHAYPSILASAITSHSTFMEFATFTNIHTGRPTMSIEDAELFISRTPDVVESARRYKSSSKLLPPSLYCTLYIILHEVDRDKAGEFFDGFDNGAGLREGSPILAMREFFIKEKLEGKKHAGYADRSANIVIYCWNKFFRGESLTTIRTSNFTPLGGRRVLIIEGWTNTSHKCSKKYIPQQLTGQIVI